VEREAFATFLKHVLRRKLHALPVPNSCANGGETFCAAAKAKRVFSLLATGSLNGH